MSVPSLKLGNLKAADDTPRNAGVSESAQALWRHSARSNLHTARTTGRTSGTDDTATPQNQHGNGDAAPASVAPPPPMFFPAHFYFYFQHQRDLESMVLNRRLILRSERLAQYQRITIMLLMRLERTLRQAVGKGAISDLLGLKAPEGEEEGKSTTDALNDSVSSAIHGEDGKEMEKDDDGELRMAKQIAMATNDAYSSLSVDQLAYHVTHALQCCYDCAECCPAYLEVEPEDLQHPAAHEESPEHDATPNHSSHNASTTDVVETTATSMKLNLNDLGAAAWGTGEGEQQQPSTQVAMRRMRTSPCAEDTLSQTGTMKRSTKIVQNPNNEVLVTLPKLVSQFTQRVGTFLEDLSATRDVSDEVTEENKSLRTLVEQYEIGALGMTGEIKRLRALVRNNISGGQNNNIKSSSSCVPTPASAQQS